MTPGHGRLEVRGCEIRRSDRVIATALSPVMARAIGDALTITAGLIIPPCERPPDHGLVARLLALSDALCARVFDAIDEPDRVIHQSERIRLCQLAQDYVSIRGGLDSAERAARVSQAHASKHASKRRTADHTRRKAGPRGPAFRG